MKKVSHLSWKFAWKGWVNKCRLNPTDIYLLLRNWHLPLSCMWCSFLTLVPVVWSVWVVLHCCTGSPWSHPCWCPWWSPYGSHGHTRSSTNSLHWSKNTQKQPRSWSMLEVNKFLLNNILIVFFYFTLFFYFIALTIFGHPKIHLNINVFFDFLIPLQQTL